VGVRAALPSVHSRPPELLKRYLIPVMDWTLLLWLAVTLAVLLLIERWIHRHMQGVMLLLTGDPEIAVTLYALPLLPGIALHELSHALAAILLGVRVGRISIRPKRTGQRIQLGFVPVEKTDAVRASLIGLAPLLAGSIAILLIGYRLLGLRTIGGALLTGDWRGLLVELPAALQTADAWLWAYVIFTVSNTMLPSGSDRQGWPPVILFLLLAGLLIWIAGLGPAVVDSLSGFLTLALRWLAAICATTTVIDLPFILLIASGEKLLERAKGWRVDYQA
jgi:hypothetical protein